jgi:hypothetical protein
LWRNDPSHGSLHFKPVSPNRPYYSVRIGEDWRAVGVKREDGVVWFWIGSHSDYDQLLKQL